MQQYKITEKKYARLLIALSSTIIFFTIGYSNYVSLKEIRIQQPLLSFDTQLSKMLSQLEQDAWCKLEKLGIDKQKLQNAITVFQQGSAHKKVSPTVSHEMRALCQQVLQDFNKKTSYVSFAKTTVNSPAWSDESVIYLDEKNMSTFSRPAQKWIIGHELQHIIHQDSLVHGYISDHMRMSNEDSKNPDHGFNCNSRFCELRADSRTALKSKEYAQGYIDFCNHLLKKNPTCPGCSHPKLTERKQLAEQIYDYHHTKTA